MQREFNPKEIVLSRTRLGHFKKSPKTFKANWIDRIDNSTDAMIRGQLCHALLNKKNDPKLIEKYVKLPEDFSLRSNDNKKRYADIQAANQIPIRFKDYESALGMAATASRDKDVIDVIRPDEDGQNEMLIEWIDKETGIRMKGFVDRWLLRKGLIADFKSAADASPEGYWKSFFKLDNDIQAAIYFDGMLENGFTPKFVTNIAIEPEYPYNLGVFNINEEVILYGRMRYKKLLKDFVYCIEENLFDESYAFWSPTRFHEITLPPYLKQKLNA